MALEQEDRRERGRGTAPAITIRPARAADDARCQEIAVAAWEPVYASTHQLIGETIFAHLYPDWRQRKAGEIAWMFAHYPQWILVACVGEAEEVVGFATYRIDAEARAGEIGNNAVAPDWQGRGIATALYERVLNAFRAAGMRVARVRTGLDDAHAPARAAYRKVGFERAVPSVTLYREL